MYKRAFSAFLAMAVLAVPLMANAGRWVTKEIGWKLSGIGPTGTSTTIWVRDTARVVFGGRSTTADTTNVFSLNDADVPPRGLKPVGGATGYTAPTDSLEFAYLVFQTDSSALGTPTIATGGVFTVILQGQIGAGRDLSPASMTGAWTIADSIVIATGSRAVSVVQIPLRTNGKWGSLRGYDNFRAFNDATTVGYLPSARCFLRYYTSRDAVDD